MKKLIFCLTATISFIIPLNSASAFYDDVLPTNQYYDSIKALYDSNLLPDDPSFNPDEILTNAELYKLLITFSETKLGTNPHLPYEDISNDSPYAKYLQTALDLGILSKDMAKIEPNKPLSKYKILETMFKTLDIGTNYFFDREIFSFVDLSPNSYITPLAQRASEIGIIESTTPKFFKMAKRITKGEAADYLYKIRQYKTKNPMSVSLVLNCKTDKTKEPAPSSISDKTEKELIEHPAFGIFIDVWDTLRSDYLHKDDLKDENLIFGAIEGMAKEPNDKYTTFERPGEDTIIDSLASKYEGIGISIDDLDGEITIITPLKNSPAEKAGLKPNDIIIKVDDENMIGAKLAEVMKKIKGPAKTTVKLTILRNKKELNFTITREELFYETVSYKFIPKNEKNIAYIELKSFNDKTFEEFLKTASKIMEQNPDGLILDLRNNPGGYMDVAINIAGLFAEKQRIALKMKYADDTTETYKTGEEGLGLLKDIKTVVLINKGTASASEILAGALKDFEAAKLIGEKTFGKGTAQDLKEYEYGNKPNENKSVLKYTSSKWLTPSGKSIDKVGIVPDRIVKNTSATDNQLNAALDEF
jgi:carboxyl-terminal processing protease